MVGQSKLKEKMFNPPTPISSMKINETENKDAMELMSEIRNDYCDLLLTDIPYNEVSRKSAGLRNLDKGDADILEIPLADLIREMVRVTKGSGYIFCGFQQISEIVRIIKETTQQNLVRIVQY